MLRIVNLHDGIGPVFACDVCMEVITDHSKAIAAYGPILTEGSMDTCYHVHKGPCNSKLEERLGGKTRWQNLRNHLQWLCMNIGLTPEQLKADKLDEIISN